jgi:ubiquinone/menaquinone biosynthesis C-methylase UbiE
MNEIAVTLSFIEMICRPGGGNEKTMGSEWKKYAGRILRHCSLCGKFNASYKVEDPRLGSLILCQSCWKRRAAQEQQRGAQAPQPAEQPDPAAAIIAHYERYAESDRLTHDLGLIEWEHTRELYARFLPPSPALVIDAGGATGVYTFWLAELGYQAHLVDIVPRHIEQARARLEAAAPGAPAPASMTVGDARALDFPDSCASAVVMHGPLYHLTERSERLRALAEARRVLQPGGVLLAVGITRFAGLVYGIARGLIFDPQFMQMARNETETGRRENPPETLFTFPQAYFHQPAELGAELSAAGLENVRTLGIIGPTWMVPDLETNWQDPDKRAAILAAARLCENEPTLGPRVLAVGYKPKEAE